MFFLLIIKTMKSVIKYCMEITRTVNNLSELNEILIER